MYKLNKTLYELKEAPRAWTERLMIYLGRKGNSKGGAAKTLLVNKSYKDMIVTQIYVDDIIFERFPEELVNHFINIMLVGK